MPSGIVNGGNPMPRYVMANRLAGKRTDSARRDSRAAVDEVLARLKGVKIVSDHRPSDDRARRIVILEAGKAKIERLRATLPPDVILEPVVEHALHYAVPIVKLATAPTVTKPPTVPYTVTVTGGGQSLPNIKVVFYMRDQSKEMWAARAVTDAGGVATQLIPVGYTVAFVRPVPHDGFWSMVVEAPPSGGTIDCAPLVSAGANGSGWWHTEMGVDTAAAGRGAGINVGVIDSGCGPHPNLMQVVPTPPPPPPGIDGNPQGHGTHTTGIVGARPTRGGDYCGMAPECNLFHWRLASTGPADIVNAIDELSLILRKPWKVLSTPCIQ